MSNFQEYLSRATRAHGDRFDDEALMSADKRARDYFNGPRVLVETIYRDGSSYRRAGRVSATTGWRPALLLMHRASDSGSSDVLGPLDRVIAIQHGGKYYAIGTSDAVRARIGFHEAASALEGVSE